jgi:hypothetical protein
MGFMDKVKQQAEQAMVKAQSGVAQGQAKLGAMSTAKQNNELLHDLGVAYYSQQRQGGPQDAVDAALAALDAAAQNGPIDLTPPSAQPPAPAQPQAQTGAPAQFPEQGQPAGPPAAAAPAPTAPPAGTPSGDFTL